MILVIGFFVALFVLLGSSLVALFLILTLIFFLIALFLPALGAARDQARRVTEASTMREIATGLEMMGLSDGSDSAGASTRPLRVRHWFPETLLWRPELITDDNGEVQIEVPLADAITTWRLTASAVTAKGELGGTTVPLRVFQPFFVELNLPIAMTRGDEVGVPIVVYNYLSEIQKVELAVQEGSWFEFLDVRNFELTLAPNEVRSVTCPIRVLRVGDHGFEVTAKAGDIADAVRRVVEVRPDGRPVDQVFNGTLADDVHLDLEVPRNAIEGSVALLVKLHPSSFSQVVEGLDNIFRRPYGCFEQTSSTTYPNVLALDYLRRTNRSAPQVETKAQQYIHLGYQRLLSFEVDGGGFDWFGSPPANRTLTAYGLMEFEDMAGVHNVDPDLIRRTRQWLFSQRNADGSWDPESHGMHDDPIRRELEKLSTTAYIAWSVYRNDGSAGAATRDYLLGHAAESIHDPYVLAVVTNALLAAGADDAIARPYLDRLGQMARRSADGKLASWHQPRGARSTFYGHGRSGQIEATATAVLALLEAQSRPDLVRAALAWLIQQKDGLGTWHSTQATVLALKALISGTGEPLAGEQRRLVDVRVNGNVEHTFDMSADQFDVLAQTNVGTHLHEGANRVTLSERSGTASGFQVVFRYHIPDVRDQVASEPLSITVDYDASELRVGDLLHATATIINNQSTEAPMVVLDLPVPAGFAIDRNNLDAHMDAAVSKVEVTPRSAILYLRKLAPGQTLRIRYRLRALMPVKVKTAPARAYEYYNPDNRVIEQGTQIHVRPQA